MGTLGIVLQLQERLTTIEHVGRKATVFIGDPPGSAQAPYLFIWSPPGVPEHLDMANEGSEIDELIHIQVVDQSTVNTLGLAEKVITLVDGWKPEDYGSWRPFTCWVEETTPVQTSRSTADYSANRFPCWCTVSVRVKATRKDK